MPAKQHLAIIGLLALFTTQMLGAEPPLLKVESVAVPLKSGRQSLAMLTPNAQGQWCYIGLFMTYKGTTEFEYERKKIEGTGREYVVFKDTAKRPDAEWTIVNLVTGKARIVDLPGFHTGGLHWVRAENGRVFFPVDFMHVTYFDPLDETIKMLGQVSEWKPFDNDRIIYAMTLGPDGYVYGTTQSYSGKTGLVRINPDTLEYKVFTDVGAGRVKSLTYGYTLAVDPPWVYVAVGQGHWEFMAVNTETGEKKLLGERKGDGARITVSSGGDVVAAGFTGPAGKPPERMWCVDGKAIPAVTNADGSLPYTPISQKKFSRVAWKNTQPLPAAGKPPELDKTRPVQPDNNGKATVWWRPAGSQAEYQSASFEIKRGEAQEITSLIELPDGSLFGPIRAYQGFFRFVPKDRQVTYYGKEHTSSPRMVVMDGKVWYFGYPNVHLSVYDPAKPWNLIPGDKPQDNANPRAIGSFGQGVTEAHHSNTILAGPNGRLYLLGARERWSTGAGLGYYDPASGKKFGLGADMKDLHPQGMVLLPKLNRLVVSGKVMDETFAGTATNAGENAQAAGKSADEAATNKTSAGAQARGPVQTAQFRVYDLDLKEVERLTLKEGLAETGAIQAIGHATRFLGRIGGEKGDSLYLYDLEKKSIVKWVELDGGGSPAFERTRDKSWWMLQGQTLCRLNTETLDLTPAGKLERPMSGLLWVGDELYGIDGGELLKAYLKPE